MATPTIFNKAKLSGSTDGKPILINTTATAGTLLHTAVAGQVANTFDEIWVWLQNNHTAAVVVTIEYGRATAPDQNIINTIPSKSGLFLALPGLILQNGLTVKCFAATNNVITASGYVNEIRP